MGWDQDMTTIRHPVNWAESMYRKHNRPERGDKWVEMWIDAHMTERWQNSDLSFAEYTEMAWWNWNVFSR